MEQIYSLCCLELGLKWEVTNCREMKTDVQNKSSKKFGFFLTSVVQTQSAPPHLLH